MLNNNDFVSIATLKEQIKTLRDWMQRLWDEKGHMDTEVLNISIELDYLINEYQRRKGIIR